MSTLTKPFHILIVRVSSLGDVVHTLPAVFLIKKLYPHATLSWVLQEKVAPLLKEITLANRLFILRDNYLNIKNQADTRARFREMNSITWDIIFDFQGLFKTTFFTFFLKGKKIGFDYKNIKFKIGSLVHDYSISPLYSNIIQKNLSLAASTPARLIAHSQGHLASEYCNASPTLEIVRNAFNKSYTIDSFPSLPLKPSDRYIVLSPNTTWKSKLWPITYWKELVALLSLHEPEYKIVLLGSHLAGDATHLFSYAKTHNIELIIPHDKSFQTIFTLLKNSSLLIAPDTGMLHLADFLNVTTIGIFGPTLATKHGPFLNEKNRSRAIQIPCNHSYKKRHGFSESCMKKLTPPALLEKIQEALRD